MSQTRNYQTQASGQKSPNTQCFSSVIYPKHIVRVQPCVINLHAFLTYLQYISKAFLHTLMHCMLDSVATQFHTAPCTCCCLSACLLQLPLIDGEPHQLMSGELMLVQLDLQYNKGPQKKVEKQSSSQLFSQVQPTPVEQFINVFNTTLLLELAGTPPLVIQQRSVGVRLHAP